MRRPGTAVLLPHGRPSHRLLPMRLRGLGWIWALLLSGWVAVTGQAQSSRGDLVLINGRLYADLGLWGARQGFRSRWNSQSGELRLTNRATQLQFKVDTARVEFDGTLLWLENPVALERGRPYVSQRDIDLTLMPLLKPLKYAKGRSVRRIAISAGHGGRDPGNMEGPWQEKVYTLKLAREVSSRLRAAGFETYMVRDEDEFIDLDERPDRANRRRADLYLSLHFNGAGGRGSSSARGAETFALTLPNGRSTHGGTSSGVQEGNRYDRENLLLAYHVHKTIIGSLDLPDRGIKRANFAELRGARMPAILIEGGFMDNPDDLRRIRSDRERGRLADAIVDGVRAYKRLVERN